MIDIKAADMGLLVSLNALLDEENVTHAAARIGISQPAMSAQLARLRDLFQDPLLVPSGTGKGMVATQRAQAVKGPLRDALKAMLDAVNTPVAFDPAVSRRTFSIACNDNAAAILALPLIRQLRDHGWDGLRVAIRAIDEKTIRDQLEAGEVDVVVTSKASVPSGLRTQPLVSDTFAMAQRKNHPRGAAMPSLAEYAALHHVIVSGSGGGFHGVIDDLLARHGLSREVRISVHHYSLAPAVLEASDFVCTLPTLFLRRFPDTVDCLPLPFPAPAFHLFMGWHHRFDTDLSHRWLRERLASLPEAPHGGAASPNGST
ncbi:LysR family transcriptional regulator [Azospirillum picis]|uniref:DNA-binding transcriptional LysR family regulator n=1 Tax=Azospirillum picis TaxID=488438 RepID=A0ABU0MJD4_9PROT|nr:LysR family transcriptional regulator [Azospirillum picis]MBP2299764.1 DNA-binding transcriptional LysR family regulator [Azospirillum picis]MDQ0533560.1 DNA-binding transcriptional LysR family regulator [Azospirillum picis]